MNKTRYRICHLSVLLVLLTACTPPPKSSAPEPAQVAQANQSYLPISPISTPTPIPTAAPTPSVVAVVTVEVAVAAPTLTPTRVIVPRPTLVPTVDPTVLPSRLTEAFTIERKDSNRYPIRRVTGWPLGLRWQVPYRWLDDTHLLLFAFTGQEYDGMDETVDRFHPAVIDLITGKTWLPQWLYPQQPLWSDALQVLITAYGQEILVTNVEGQVVQRYPHVTPSHPASSPLYLSPSGKRLWTGWVWRDLETGQTVDLCQYEQPMHRPGWSDDETRLFSCCFGYADARTEQCSRFDLGELRPVGRGGELYAGPGQWVLDDARAMVWWDFAEADTPAVPLIDPQTHSYVDLCESTGLPEPLCYPGILPGILPGGEHVHLGNYIIDLRNLVAQPLPKRMRYYSSSPDGALALLVEEDKAPTGSPAYNVLFLASGRIRRVTEAATHVAWSPDGKQLAFLSADSRTLNVLNTRTWDSQQMVLDLAASGIFWQPQGDKLVIQAKDRSVWWIVDLGSNTVDQLLASMPFAGNLSWSPDGHSLAFVNEKDVHIVTVDK